MFGWKAKPAASRKSSRLKSTKSFIYFPDQILGEGATSSVYLGRNKKTGEKVAVKVFNVTSYHRPGEVQDREFDVLHKLQHENIVRLLAIEDDSGTKERVIIMELCDCSVLNMLETPEYYYGFQENEFLGILKDITEGMKYLQNMDIVHRDIKPGNIMRRIGPDKRSSFKLADFGAARELEQNQPFMSLYGTEEYLHPDMYGRALLRKTPNNPFTSKVDLWSLGVTLYHIVTGDLPFRPFGGRKNKQTMYEMTANKATGVISAVQQDSMKGQIEYDKELPVHCHLSEGLRQLVTPLLAGLLESNPNKMWPFQTFFEYTKHIFGLKRSFIFQHERSNLIKMYSNPESSLAEFQEQIASYTDIPADQQILVIDGHLFQPDSTKKCIDYPETSELSPLILWQRKQQHIPLGPILPNIPPMPANSVTHSLDEDVFSAKERVAVVSFLMKYQKQLFLISDLYPLVAKGCCRLISSHTMKLQYHHAVTKGLQVKSDTLLQSKQRELVNLLALLNGYRNSNGNFTDAETLKTLEQDISVYAEELNRIDTQFVKVDSLMTELVPSVIESDPITKWDSGARCAMSQRCSERLEVLQSEIRNIYEAFIDDRRAGKLSYNDEQVHKMAMARLHELSAEATELVYDHCQENVKQSHSNFIKWFSELSDLRDKIDQLDELLTPLSQELTECMSKINQESGRWSDVIDEIVHNMTKRIENQSEQTTSRNKCSLGDLETDGASMDGAEVGEQPMVTEQTTWKEEFENVLTETADDTIQQSRQLLNVLSKLPGHITPVDLSDIEISDEDEHDFVDISAE